ncbi:triose-phosphate transporter family-domain-containing protein [Plectosphaerella cucumerina]|uniref:Triose-phosphate transporter family-domain-containing protein n=1 Tax=Plectosphaerella cucumerina TaxID=40658 RepID=A0A8K0TQG2_9PEZI|nr:triose-phosphate transporter family-domain-containing protein [Plectosphaerella cucumerina]
MASNQEEPSLDRRSEERDGLLDGDEKGVDASQYDVEARAGITNNLKDKTVEKPVEYSISPNVKFAWLSAYFFFSLILTLYNKLVLGVFPFPWLLTSLHASCATIGCYGLLQMNYFTMSRLGRRENLVLLAFSLLFTINIAVSNLSLAMVSVPFYQVLRTSVPVFTVLIYRVVYSRTYDTITYLTLVPIMLGAALTTIGEYTFTDMGFLLTFAGVLSAAVKTVATNRIMTGPLSLPAMEVLLRMSPYAVLQSLLCAFAAGEFSRVREMNTNEGFAFWTLIALLGNGTLAFALNVASFQTNKVAGALTISVCGNLKQCLTVLLGIVAFGVEVHLFNGTGMILTMVGAAWYSKVELDRKSRK